MLDAEVERTIKFKGMSCVRMIIVFNYGRFLVAPGAIDKNVHIIYHRKQNRKT